MALTTTVGIAILPLMLIGHHLKIWRDSLHLTQDAAAKRIGVIQSTWSDLEHDRVCPRADTLQKLLRVGAVPIQALMVPDPNESAEKPVMALQRAKGVV